MQEVACKGEKKGLQPIRRQKASTHRHTTSRWSANGPQFAHFQKENLLTYSTSSRYCHLISTCISHIVCCCTSIAVVLEMQNKAWKKRYVRDCQNCCLHYEIQLAGYPLTISKRFFFHVQREYTKYTWSTQFQVLGSQKASVVLNGSQPTSSHNPFPLHTWPH